MLPTPHTGARNGGTTRSASEPGPFLPLVGEPVATHAAEELGRIDRLRKLLVQSDGCRDHAAAVYGTRLTSQTPPRRLQSPCGQMTGLAHGEAWYRHGLPRSIGMPWQFWSLTKGPRGVRLRQSGLLRW